MIELINVTKTYKKRFKKIYALKDFSYTFLDKGFYCIIGESGSGKSTLLNLISLLDFPTNGEVYFNNELIDFKNTLKNDKLRRENFSLIYEENNLLMNETLLNNILYFLKFKNKKISYEKLYYYMDYLELKKDLLDEKVNSFSGGEISRVLLLRTLLSDSKILLLDEVTSSLDYENSINIFKILKELSKDRLIICITHDVKLSYKYASFILSLKDGKLIKEEKSEIKESSNSQIVNSFDDFNVIKYTKFKLIKRVFKSNLLLYFLSFIFSLIFCIGLNISLSTLKNNATKEVIQEVINNSNDSIYLSVTSSENKILTGNVILEFDKISQNKLEICSGYFSSSYFKKQNLLDYTFKGTFPDSTGEILVSYTTAQRIIKNNNLSSLDECIGKSYEILFYDESEDLSGSKWYEFTVTGYFLSSDDFFILDDTIYNELVSLKLLSDKPYEVNYSLKDDGFINFIDNFEDELIDQSIIKFDNVEYFVYFNDNNIPNYYFNTYQNLSIALSLVYLPSIVISSLFLLFIYYSIIFKNKDSITMFRTLGLGYKDSFIIYNFFNIIFTLLSNVFSIILSNFIIYKITDLALQFSVNNMIFFPISLNALIIIFSFILSFIFVIGLTSLLLFKVYKNKRIIKL